jgi:1,4-alpha-glucan branching enzyme
VQLPRDAADGAVYVAGDFSDWQPRPMRLTGDSWELALTLGAGVYHYSFIDANGRWFVPDSVPGRVDDGMGGHVAVLVVQ